MGLWLYSGAKVLCKLARSQNEPSIVVRDETRTTSSPPLPSRTLGLSSVAKLLLNPNSFLSFCLSPKYLTHSPVQEL